MTAKGLIIERTVSQGLLDQEAGCVLRLRFSTNTTLQVKWLNWGEHVARHSFNVVLTGNGGRPIVHRA